jgi:acetyltransferase-like isoleucine patch superfamily enzyme
MSFWIWLSGGHTVPYPTTLGRRMGNWWGRRLALRHKRVTIGRDCAISPESRICPRKGRIVIGDDCIVAHGAAIQGNVAIGNHCSLQSYGTLVGGQSANPDDGITIGNHVRIAMNCMMMAMNHNFGDITRTINGQGCTEKFIRVKDDVWIGGYVKILAGMTIGSGCVIGAGAVVTRDIPPFSVVTGVPARVIRSRKTLCTAHCQIYLP